MQSGLSAPGGLHCFGYIRISHTEAASLLSDRGRFLSKDAVSGDQHKSFYMPEMLVL